MLTSYAGSGLGGKNKGMGNGTTFVGEQESNRSEERRKKMENLRFYTTEFEGLPKKGGAALNLSRKVALHMIRKKDFRLVPNFSPWRRRYPSRRENAGKKLWRG